VLFLVRKEPVHRAARPSLSSQQTILAVGDSLTNGYGAPAGESYPEHLQKMTSLHIVKSGINGELSSEGVRRLPLLLQRYRPKLTLLCYGGNDILQKRPVQQLKENLKKMIALCHTKGSDVLLIAVPHATLFGLAPLSAYEEVAKETQTPLLSGSLSTILETPSMKSDMVHPNAKGYKTLAKDIYEAMKRYGWLTP